jgi:uncharacterized membrane protein
MSAASLFTEAQRECIVAAIQAAEKETSGEIRVHIEKTCKEEVLDRAAWWFKKLNMQHTSARNGVLIYLAVRSHKFAIIGDEGINAVVPAGFWDETKEEMRKMFVAGKFVEGIAWGITEAGRLLKQYFPYTAGDVNELPDEISFGN